MKLLPVLMAIQELAVALGGSATGVGVSRLPEAGYPCPVAPQLDWPQQ